MCAWRSSARARSPPCATFWVIQHWSELVAGGELIEGRGSSLWGRHYNEDPSREGTVWVRTGRRSRPLGPATMSGLRKLRFTCLLRRWKYCAGVVGNVTCMFTFAPSEPSWNPYGSFESLIRYVRDARAVRGVLLFSYLQHALDARGRVFGSSTIEPIRPSVECFEVGSAAYP